MKTVEEYMKLPYQMNIVEDPYEGGFVVSFPELPGCITCVDSFDDIYPMAEDAKKVWLQAALADGVDIQEPRSVGDYSGNVKLRMPKFLHRRLAEEAEREGVSLNQYCVCLLSTKRFAK